MLCLCGLYLLLRKNVLRRNVGEQNYGLTTRSQLTSVSGENFSENFGENCTEQKKRKGTKVCPRSTIWCRNKHDAMYSLLFNSILQVKNLQVSALCNADIQLMCKHDLKPRFVLCQFIAVNVT